MDRLFLDANVLFSAAYREHAGLAKLWGLRGATLISSAFAVEEARFNLESKAQHDRLNTLIGKTQIIPEQPDATPMPAGITLPEKDQPILAAAIRAEATHLITGDLQHFGPYMGKTIQGILILTPSEYLSRRKGR